MWCVRGQTFKCWSKEVPNIATSLHRSVAAVILITTIIVTSIFFSIIPIQPLYDSNITPIYEARNLFAACSMAGPDSKRTRKRCLDRRGNIGVMEKKMEITIMGYTVYISGLSWCLFWERVSESFVSLDSNAGICWFGMFS